MTGQPFLTALLGDDAAIAVEAAFGADLTDTDGSGWSWTDLTADARHDPGIPVTIGRSDNVSQAGAAAFSVTLNNTGGLYTPGGPNDLGVVQNTPIRQRMTLNGTDWFTRFQGYLDSANPATDQSAKVKGVDVAALGALGRLSGQKKPLKSPLYRATQANTNLVAHWPMEDGTDAASAASAVTGVLPMTVPIGLAAPKFGDAGPAGSVTGANFAAGALTAVVPNATTGSFRVQAAIRINNIAGPSATDILWSIHTSNGGLFELTYYTDTGSMELTYVSPAATGGTAFTSVPADGDWHLITINILQDSGDITCNTYVDDGHHFSFTIHSDTLGKITDITVASGSISTTPVTGVIATDFNMSGLAVASPTTEPPPEITNTAAAMDGFAGETADDRLTRLCTEQGIALDLTGSSDIAMGPQTPDTILNLLRECEAADHGVLFDGLGPGVGYQCRTERYNADAVLTLDMGTPREVETFRPIFDKQAIKNLYTVNRKNGSSGTFEDVDGTLGTATIGVEDASVTINIATDDPLVQHAGWLVGLGTIPGFRYPGVGLNLRAIPTRADDVLALVVGSRITIQNPASKATDLPADDINLFVEGWTETTTASTWSLALNTSPYRPFRVFVLDEDEMDDPDVFLAL